MNKNSRLLTIIIALQALTFAGQWSGNSYLTSTHAQIADPGRDRQQLIEETRKTNQKLDNLLEILRSGELQVRVIQSDDNKAKPAAR